MGRSPFHSLASLSGIPQASGPCAQPHATLGGLCAYWWHKAQRSHLAHQRVQWAPEVVEEGEQGHHSEAVVAGVGPPTISAWSELLNWHSSTHRVTYGQGCDEGNNPAVNQDSYENKQSPLILKINKSLYSRTMNCASDGNILSLFLLLWCFFYITVK